MTFQDNFSITHLFLDKDIEITIDNKQYFKVRAHSIRDFYQNRELNSFYHLWTAPLTTIQKLFFTPVKNTFDAITTLIFEYGMYDQYRSLANITRNTLPLFVPDAQIDMVNKVIKINDITMTSEICEYIFYVLKLSCGEKVNQPLTFDSEEARKFFMAQKEQDDRIAKLRQQKQDKEALGKALLSITYAFPSLTIDYLCNQTMAQIQWLRSYAAGALSYEVNADAFAAGNMKKGSKLTFFIQ